MKKFITALFALSISITFVCAQTVDEIADAYTKAMGGKEKLMALNSVRMTGSMSTQGIDVPMVFSKLHMKGMRIDMEIMGSSNYQLGNLTKAYAFMPVMGQSAPEEMPAESFKSVLNEYDVQGFLFDYKAKGYKIVLAGKEKVDNAEAFKMEVTYPNGENRTYFIDVATNRLIKSISKRSVNGQEMENITTFADYKQNKDGYWFAYTLGSSQGNIIFDTVETNVAIPETLFTN